jgi:hypothetical protein
MVVQLAKKLLAFYGTQSFIIVFTKPTTDPYPEPDESNPVKDAKIAKDKYLFIFLTN